MVRVVIVIVVIVVVIFVTFVLLSLKKNCTNLIKSELKGLPCYLPSYLSDQTLLCSNIYLDFKAFNSIFASKNKRDSLKYLLSEYFQAPAASAFVL